MPTFELSGPDGGTYQIQSDTAAGAVDVMNSMFKPPEKSLGEDLAGVAKAAPGRAVAGIAGIPGDLLHLGTRALGDNLTPESAFGSDAIAKALGSDYQAKTETGRVTQKIVDFAPAMIGGPETLALKALTRVAVPVAASEAGRAVAGPYGEVAGALAGAGGATAAARRFQEAQAARRAVPSVEDTIRTAKSGFKSAEDMNLTVTPDWATNAAAKMRSDLKGFDPEAQAAVFKAADRLEGLASTKTPNLSATQRLELEMNGMPVPAAKPLPVAMNEAELVRKQLVNLKQSNEAPIREAARRAITSLQESQLAIDPSQVLRGDAADYAKTMRDAIGNYAAGKRSNTVMGKVALGDLNAATAGSGANEDNALRQAIKQLVRPVNNDIVPKASRLGFNQNEINAMNKVARGTAAGNAARYLGKLAPTGSVSGVLSAGAGYGAAGPAGAVALPAIGYLAKKIGDMSTKHAVAALDHLVRSRSPFAQQVAAQLPPAVVEKLPIQTKLLLASAAARPIVAPQLIPQGSQ